MPRKKTNKKTNKNNKIVLQLQNKAPSDRMKAENMTGRKKQA